MRRRSRIGAAWALAALASWRAASLTAAEAIRVRPSETDPRITAFDSPHSCWTPTGPDRHELFLFLPGTGGHPSEHSGLAETAAALGYHAVSLMYPDNVAAQIACGGSHDPDCHMKFRLGIIRGGSTGTHKRTIAHWDSIESRLERLLVHLAKTRPAEGWGEFLGEHGAVRWRRVAVSGHSQGGGHACVLAKIHEVARVLALGSPKDYSFYFRRPARGFDGKSDTPLDRYFTFNHLRDNGNGCTHAQQMEILKQMGLDRLGVVDADAAGPDFDHGHVLVTNVDIHGTRFHGSVLNAGHPVCVRAWKYALGAPAN